MLHDMFEKSFISLYIPYSFHLVPRMATLNSAKEALNVLKFFLSQESRGLASLQMITFHD